MKNEWEERGDQIVIFINYKGAILETKISPGDFTKVNAFPNTWYIHESNCNIYVRGQVRRYGHTIKVVLSRYIMDCPEWLFVDHKNRNTLDNQRGNLRIVTHEENMQNRGYTYNAVYNAAYYRREPGKSGILGVVWCESKQRWRARLRHKGKVVFERYFRTAEEAEAAVKEARSRLGLEVA